MVFFGSAFVISRTTIVRLGWPSAVALRDPFALCNASFPFTALPSGMAPNTEYFVGWPPANRGVASDACSPENVSTKNTCPSRVMGKAADDGDRARRCRRAPSDDHENSNREPER